MARQCPVHGTTHLGTHLSSPAAVHLALAIGTGKAGHPGPISHEPERGARVLQPVYPGPAACDHSERSADSKRGDLAGRSHTCRTMLEDLGTDRHPWTSASAISTAPGAVDSADPHAHGAPEPESSGLPSTQVDLGVAALLAHLPKPGLGKLACIWQLATRPSGSPCLARLGRRSDVTPCYASVTVHSLFRRAWTTHHWEDHPTRDPLSGRAPSITWRSPTNADARWVVPAAQARRLHRMAMESSTEERNVHARPEHRHGHRNSIGTGGRS